MPNVGCPCTWGGGTSVRCSLHAPAVEPYLLEQSMFIDDLRDQIRRTAATIRADIAAVAPQDNDGVFTITTLSTQEHP